MVVLLIQTVPEEPVPNFQIKKMCGIYILNLEQHSMTLFPALRLAHKIQILIILVGFKQNDYDNIQGLRETIPTYKWQIVFINP